MSKHMIDLDAARREQEQPDGFPVVLKGETFNLPAELPVDVFDPFLSAELDLAGLIRDAMGRWKAAEAAEASGGPKASIASVVTDTLFDRPSLPIEVINAIFAAFEALFGAEQYAAFKAQRPTLNDYSRLTSGLFGVYGVSLGEAFASPASSASDGATPKETSESTPSSTSEVSGDAPASEGGSSE